MTRKTRRGRCAHPGCRARVARGRELCREHAGVAPEELAALGEPVEETGVPTLEEEIARLARQRDRAEELLERWMAQAGWEGRDVVRCLTQMSQAGKGLAGLLLRRAGQSGASDLEEFLAVVTQRVRDKKAGKADT